MVGVYQPRPRRALMADALDDARRALSRLSRLLVMRGAGLLVLLATSAALIALLSYDSGDASLNNATGDEVSNLLGPIGATAADLLLQAFGFASIAFLAPLAVWGTRALMGQTMRHAVARAFAWPLGTVLLAAGLGTRLRPLTTPRTISGCPVDQAATVTPPFATAVGLR